MPKFAVHSKNVNMNGTTSFISKDFKITDWASLEPYFKQLIEKPINSAADFEQWLIDRSDLESIVSEDLAWRYIRMTCDTTNKEIEDAYLYFVSEIQPHISPVENELNEIMANSPYAKELTDSAHKIYFRNTTTALELFREENIPIEVELQTESQKYGSISGAMTVDMEGKELTLQQAAVYLKKTDRTLRQEAFEKISTRRLQDRDTLDDLLNKLIGLRHQMAKNTGFDNFRDYMHTALCRFDYTVEDCFKFHEAVAGQVVPIAKKLAIERKEKLGYESLRPWDGDVDTSGLPPVHPFNNGEELAQKTIAAFNRLDPFFGDVISTMRAKGHLDLDSRKGKAPGGYNYPLAVSNYPFIFMNSAGTLRDLETMVHEGGHAIHSVLTKDLELNAFKSCPSEVAELASMSMELISMDVWDEFIKDPAELRRAKAEQLEGVIKTLPWIATVDKFQHWIYTHPTHTVAERTEAWKEFFAEFGTGTTDWSGHQAAYDTAWQKQLHIYEVPFYYIEYGFAQLGAIGVWKNYTENPQRGLQLYKAALTLGNTATIPEIYAAAGVKFDFSPEYIKQLFDFVWAEYEKLK
jgi:oligoendopeptidase F